jgi:hypothetical protein
VYRTRHYLATLISGRAGLDPSRIALAINRHDSRTMDSPAAIARALALPLAVCVTADSRRVNLALRDDRPVVLDGGGAISRQLVGLADQLAAREWPPAQPVSTESWAARLRRAWGSARATIKISMHGGRHRLVGVRRARRTSTGLVGKAYDGKKTYDARAEAATPSEPVLVEAVASSSATNREGHQEAGQTATSTR